VEPSERASQSCPLRQPRFARLRYLPPAFGPGDKSYASHLNRTTVTTVSLS
jgi:hypothetical protein